MDNNLKLELNKYKAIIDILNSNNKELITYLYNDCFYTFIKKNDKIKSKYEEFAKIIQLLVQLRLKTRLNNDLNINFIYLEKIELKSSLLHLIENNEEVKEKVYLDIQDGNEEGDGEIEPEDDIKNSIPQNSKYLDQFISIINFILSYSKEINTILEMYQILLENIPSIYEDIISIIVNNKIKMEESKRNPNNSRIIKFSFFYIIEPMCKILKEKISNILMEKIDAKKKILSIQFFIENAIKLEKNLLLFSNEILSLEIIVKLIDQIKLNNQKEFIELINETLKVISINDIDKLDNNMNFINISLSKIFGENSKEYYKLIFKIILNKYKSESSNQFREKLIGILLDHKRLFNNQILEYCFPIIQIIFNFSSLEQNICNIQKKNFFSFIKDENSIKKLINESNNIKINEILLYRFEILFEYYFQIKINNININKICENLSDISLLEEAINYIYNKKDIINTNLKNIYKLFSIAFIKKYLFYYIKFLLTEEGYQNLAKRTKINKLLFMNNIPQTDIVKFYSLKLLLNQLGKWEDYTKFIFEKDNTLEFKNYFSELLENKEKYFLLQNKSNEEFFEYIRLLFGNKLNNENKNKFNTLFLNNNNYEQLYLLLSNILLLSYYYKSWKNNNKNIIIEKEENNNNIFEDLIISLNNYINEQNIDKNIIDFMNTLFKRQIFNDIIIPKLGLDKEKEETEMKIKKIKILLFAFRYIFSILINKNDNKNLFYNNLLTKKVISTIENNFIPGNFRDIDKDNDNNIKGLNLIDKDLFFKKNKEINYTKYITYRLLNFILYSFLFYSNIQGFIKDNKLSNYLINSKTCFEIIEDNWNFIEESFKNDKIEIILNIIFDSIKEQLIITEIFKKKNDVENFENKINSIIMEKINNNELIQKYKEINNTFINYIPYSNKAIIEEKYSGEIYSDEKYPNLKYFYTSEFPNQEDFIKKFNELNNKEEKYPILYTIINDKSFREKIELMKNIPIMNKICNFMINYCSFRYSREEAKKLKINEHNNDFEKVFENLKDFKEFYKNIISYIKNEKLNEIDEKFDTLKDELTLSDLCVDSGEKNYGYILLLIYQKMSIWQNSFIEFIINSKNEDLKKYKEIFETKIMIQNCEEEHIIKLPQFENEFKKEDKKKDNINLMKLIKNNSYRKENKIFYNYEDIEEQLGSDILPKIKSFKNEFRTVIYQYETFIGKRRGIITNFIDKYKQRKLSEKELQLIIKYIEKRKNDLDIKNMLFCLQILIDIILEHSYEINITIFSIIAKFENIPGAEIIRNLCDENNNEDNLFTIDCLIDLIDIIQLFCWDNIKENLDVNFFNDIDENIKEKLDKHFDKNNLEKNNFKISKIDFCSAIRIYVSRYLGGKNNENMNPKNDLNIYLKKMELWTNNYDIINIENEIDTIFKGIKVELSQAIKIYDYLGGDKCKLEEIMIKYKEKKDEKNDINNKNNIDEEKEKEERITNRINKENLEEKGEQEGKKEKEEQEQEEQEQEEQEQEEQEQEEQEQECGY